MKLAPSIGAGLAIIGALILAKQCGYRAGAQAALAIQRDAAIDSVVHVEKQRTSVDSLRFQRQRDSTGRVIRALEKRIAGGRPATPQPASTSAAAPIKSGDEAASAPLLLRDSLIASLLSGRQQDSLQLLFWKAQVSQRDSVISTLQASRNAWRRAAEPSFVKRVGRALPWLAGAYLVGRLTK